SRSEQLANTYQWRKNLVNLVNGGRIGGADTDHLVITGAVYADSGLYDCVVTQNSIVEPSREAQVTVQQTAGVDPAIASLGMSLSAPRPNPSVGRTKLEFTLTRESPVSLAIYDALGRRVKALVPLQSLGPGSHTIEWDGTDATGVRV